MILKDISLFTFKLHLSRPLHFSEGTITHREGILLRLISEQGRTGWGECSPLPGYSRDTLESAADSLRHFRHVMKNTAVPSHVEELSGALEQWLSEVDLSASARFAVETGVLALLAAQRSTTLADVLAAHPAHCISVNGMVGRGHNDDIDEQVGRLMDAGYKTVKLKVGGHSVDRDIERTKIASERLGTEAALRLDANQAWTFDDAMRFASGITDRRIEFIEEPLRKPQRLPEFAAAASLPVALDESLVGMLPEEIQSFHNLAALIIRPTVLGGAEHAMRLIRWARQRDITPVISSALESAVGIAALANLAAASGSSPAASGLDTISWFDQQLSTTPLEITGGTINCAQAFTAGQSVDVSLLEDISDG